MRTRTRGQDVLITAHTYSNRSLGIFLMFLGVVASWPCWYMYMLWFSHSPKTWEDWYPVFFAAVLLVAAGFFLAFVSYKKILVNQAWIRVTDGPLHKPLTFRWEGEPSVRLQSIVSEHHDRPQTTWIVKLVFQRFEYTLDERLGQQLESRAVAEAVAKALGCALLEKNEDGKDVIIKAADLDLPFGERVKRYPALLGKPIPQPPNAGVTRTEAGGRVEFAWGVVTSSLLLSMVALWLMFFVISAVPPKLDQHSYLERARNTGDYSLYYETGAIVGLALVVSAGFRLRIGLTPKEVVLSKSLWGVPLVKRSLPVCDVEEVQVVHTVRGPVVQIVGDRTLIQFQAADANVAGWLAHEIRAHLAALDEKNPCASKGS